MDYGDTDSDSANTCSVDIDEIIANLNKNRDLCNKSNIHPYVTDKDKTGAHIVDEIEISRGRPKTKKLGNLKVKVSLKSIYRYMNAMINYVMGLNNELKYDNILVKGLDELDKDDVILNYTTKLNELRKNSSVCTTFRYSCWDSHDEDFHFLYECNEIHNVVYSNDNDIRIGSLSHDLKLHKHKLICIALNYGAKILMSEYGNTNNGIYNNICEEIEWFRDEYRIKTVNLSMRFEKDNQEPLSGSGQNSDTPAS